MAKPVRPSKIEWLKINGLAIVEWQNYVSPDISQYFENIMKNGSAVFYLPNHLSCGLLGLGPISWLQPQQQLLAAPDIRRNHRYVQIADKAFILHLWLLMAQHSLAGAASFTLQCSRCRETGRLLVEI